MDRCAEVLAPRLPRPLLSVMYPAGGDTTPLDQTRYTQPALFALEWSLAAMWRAWGIEPAWVMGHSLGEYAAACVAGVFTLEDGLTLVAERARLMQALPEGGAMTAALGAADRVLGLLEPLGDGVSVAAINGPESVVLSGPSARVADARAALEAAGVRTRPVAVSHAFHSALMEPVQEELARLLAGIRLRPPAIGLISNRTGRPAGGDVAEAGYWVRQMREPVRFADGIQALDAQGCRAFLEIGPSPTLVGLGRACVAGEDRLWLASLRRDGDDWAEVLQSLATLYVHGADVQWDAFDRPYARRKVTLPTYPFERKRFWAIGPARPEAAVARVEPGRLYELAWRERPHPGVSVVGPAAGRWLLLADRGGVGQDLARRLEHQGESCTLLSPAPAGGADPGYATEVAVRDAINKDAAGWRGIVHLQSLDAGTASPSAQAADAAASVGSVIRAMAAGPPAGARLWVVTRGAQGVRGRGDALAGAAVWGLGRVAALEHPDLWGGLVDLDPDGGLDASLLASEIRDGEGEDQVAFRGGVRHVARLVRRDTDPVAALELRPDATYLVTGGLGALGLRVARWMTERGARRLVLVSRREAGEPARAALAECRERGAEVRVALADVADEERMRAVLAEVAADAPLRGVVHAAGVMPPSPIAAAGPEPWRAAFRAKVAGGWLLHELTAAAPLDFFVTFSSAAGVWGSVGLGPYAAANQWLDALVRHRRQRGRPGLSVAWGPWDGGGMTTDDSRAWFAQMGVRPLAPADALASLAHLLAAGASEATVANVDWAAFRPLFEARRMRRLLAEIAVPSAPAGEPGHAAAGEASTLSRELAAADAAGRRELLTRHLSALWREVLRVDVVRPEDDFFALGGDSIMGLQLASRAGARGLRLGLKQLLDHPTLGGLASALAAAAAPAEPRPDGEPALPNRDGLALTADDLAAITAEIERSAELSR
jgi:epothilone polyketide synthase D